MSESAPESAADEVALTDLIAFVAAVDSGKFARARELAARILAVEPENELILKYSAVLRGREDEEESSEEEEEESSSEEEFDNTGNIIDGVSAVEGGGGDGGDAADEGEEDGAGDDDDDRGCAGGGAALDEEEMIHASKIRRSIAQAQALDAELNT